MKNFLTGLAASVALALAFACGGESTEPVLYDVPVAGVAIEGKLPRMMVGDKATLGAMLLPARATNQNVTWSSDAPSVATVEATGVKALVLAKKVGEATITVRTADGGFTDTFRMLISDGTTAVWGVTLNRTAMSMVPGGSSLLTATVSPNSATNQEIEWGTSDDKKVEVMGNGLSAMLTAKDNGTATITATTKDGGYKASCVVTVEPYVVPVAAIAFGKPSMDVLLKRGTVALQLSVLPPNANLGTVSYTSSATKVATVLGAADKATVTLLDYGATVITATTAGKTASCVITVGEGGAASAAAVQTYFAAYSSSFAIKENGKLYAWGSNGGGRLGNGNTNAQTAPVPVVAAGADEWRFVTGGDGHSAGIQTDGTLWCWGSNTYGKCGIGVDGGIATDHGPVQVGSDDDWSWVACGDNHTMAIKTDGSLWAWGYNGNGRLGLGTTTSSYNTPQQVGQDNDWATVACGISYTVALRKDGTIWAWGYNGVGQLGQGDTDVDRSVPTKVGNDSNWVKVTTNQSHNIAIKDDGSIWAWGSNSWGRCGTGPGSSNVLSPTAVVVADNPKTWRDAVAGGNASSGIKSDGTVWGWGDGLYGKLGNGGTADKDYPTKATTDVTDFVGISMGYYQTIALRPNGDLWTWGQSPQNGNGSSNILTPRLLGGGWMVP